MIKELTSVSIDEVFDLYMGHNTLQGVHKDSAFYHHKIKGESRDDEWKAYYAEKLDDPTFHSFGEFNEEGMMRAFVNTHEWGPYHPTIWNLDRMVSSKYVPQTKSHGGIYWPDSVIDLVNYAVDFYEQKGYDTVYTLRTAAISTWMPITDVADCKLSKYKSERVEFISAFGKAANTVLAEKVSLNTNLTTPQYIIKLARPY